MQSDATFQITGRWNTWDQLPETLNSGLHTTASTVFVNNYNNHGGEENVILHLAL